MKQRDTTKAYDGFTLIEMLIAFGVWAIFATLTMVNVASFKPVTEVEAAADIFYSQLIFAQNLASTGLVYADQLPFGSPDGVKEVPNGYGVHVHIDTSAATAGHWIYADLYDPISGIGNMYYDVTMGGIAEKISSQSATVDTSHIQVTIKRNDTGFEGNLSTPAAPKPLDIFFETPGGAMAYYFDGIPYTASSGINNIIVEFAYIKDPSILQRVFIERLANQAYYEIEN